MKRIVFLAVLATFVLGLASMASAVELKWKGEYRFTAKWGDNWDFYDADEDGASEDDFGARQRFRLQTDFIASELLKGVFYIESGETVWGGDSVGGVGKGSGGAIGADGVSIEVRRAYIEFMLPDTNLTFKVGIQGFALPSIDALGPPVLGGTGTDMAGVVASLKVSDNVSLAGVWFRPLDAEGDIEGDSPAADEIDVFGVVAPMSFDGFGFNPYFAAAFSGKDVPLSGLASTAGYSDDATSWWFGANFDVTMMDPLYFGLDVVYGSTSADSDNEDRAGWYIQALLAYDMGYMTPAIAAWYSTGDDDDASDGSEVMPVIDPAFFGTTFGFDGYSLLGGGDIVNYNALATMGVAFLLQDISFVEDLTHTLRVAYVRGTHDEDAVGIMAGESTVLTEEDSAWEIDFDHTYQIFDQLALQIEMGYVTLNLDDDIWNDDTSDAWKVGFQLKYNF